MLWKGAIGVAAFALQTVCAIFIDDAYNVDYHEALLGFPQPHTTFFHKPHISSNASLLYTLSDKAVLGAVNPRDGSIIWRQAIYGSPQDNVSATFNVPKNDGRVVTAFKDSVTSYDSSDGRLIATCNIHGEIAGLEPVPPNTATNLQDLVILTRALGGSPSLTVSRLEGEELTTKWEFTDSTASVDAQVDLAVTSKHVYYVSKSSTILSGGKVKITVLDIDTGKEGKSYSVAVDGNGLGLSGQLIAGKRTEFPFLVAADKSLLSINFNLLGHSKPTILSIDAKNEVVESLDVHTASGDVSVAHFLVHLQSKTRKHWAEVYHINTKNGDAKRAYSLPSTAETSVFAASYGTDSVYFTRVTDTEVSVYDSNSHGYLGRWSRSQPRMPVGRSSRPITATAEIVNRGSGNVAVRVAVLSSEGSWYLIRNGDTQWTRPEMLSYTTLAVWSEDIVIDPLVRELQEEVLTNPATAYINRIYRHTAELRHLPQYLLDLPQRLLGQGSNLPPMKSPLVGTRYIIAVTSRNYMFAIDANSGRVRWQTELSNVKAAETDFKYLAYEIGRIVAYSGDGSRVVVNVTDGTVIEHKAGTVQLADIVELPGSPASTIVEIGKDGVPYPSSDSAASGPYEGNVIVTLSDTGTAVGWSVGSTIKQMWTLKPPHDEKFVTITSRPRHDPVASIGRVLGDRAVLYKYVTPNLALLESVGTSSLTMYLVDAVTGTTLFTSSHKGILADVPISAVLSENWFAYSFTLTDPDTKGISTQIIISEMYESATSNDRGLLAARANYSSFAPDAVSKPHVISQAFTVSEPISAMTVSQTSQGITSRSVLAYLSRSRSVISIPRHMLDARRVMERDPTSLELEEGLLRYHPVLDLDPKGFQSHALEVLGLKHIISSPTLLESTSAIFGFGHDIFGTQLAPSMTFDVLGKNFNRIQLVLTVVALYVGVVALRPMVRKQMVDRGWQ